MPNLTIDNRPIEIPDGQTVLDAARLLGIEIPTLCYLDGVGSPTSCLVCLIKLVDSGKLVPACATVAREGMRVESETAEVHDARRTALSLLLSDHVGDCRAPCSIACPGDLDIARMLREIADGDLLAAATTIYASLAMPGVLSYVCPAPCEKTCRRRPVDGEVAICRLKQYVVDAMAGNLAAHVSAQSTGKSVAIVGAGPTGLSAALYLARLGHAVTIYEAGDEPGGRLLTEFDTGTLPPEVLQRDLDVIRGVGVTIRCGHTVDPHLGLTKLGQEHAAVLVATGNASSEPWREIAADVSPDTCQTKTPGIFAAGLVVRGRGMAARSVGDGRRAAVAIGQFLEGQPVLGEQILPEVRAGRLDESELRDLMTDASPSPLATVARDAPLDQATAADQAARCLHCDCRQADDCMLRIYAQQYGVKPPRGKNRRPVRRNAAHAKIVHEPGKCIQCGRCLIVTAQAGEPLGLTRIGRGFDVEIGVPLGGRLQDGITTSAEKCDQVCPTGALALRKKAKRAD